VDPLAGERRFVLVRLPTGHRATGTDLRRRAWELDSRGSAVHLYIYVTDRYSIGPSPMPFLERIADGLTDGQT